MALTTFRDLWSDLLLMAPNLPIPIAQRLINNALVRVYDAARWSDLRQQAEFFIPIGTTAGTVTVLNGSQSVAGSSTAWTSNMVGWQFFLAEQAPYYTVTAVDTIGQLLTLDRPFGGSSVSGVSHSLQLLYLPVPTDFQQFIDIVDTANQWRLYFNITAEQIDLWDPARTTSEMSWLFAQIQPTAVGGKPRFEIYPRPAITAEHSYPYRYIRRLPEMAANADLPIFPVRAQTLREGALAELARWPGTSDRQNLYFNLELSAFHEKQFGDALARDMRADQEINMTDVVYEGGWTNWPMAPFSASFMQSHLFPAWYSSVVAF